MSSIIDKMYKYYDFTSSGENPGSLLAGENFT